MNLLISDHNVKNVAHHTCITWVLMPVRCVPSDVLMWPNVIKKQTSESTAHLPVPEDEKPKLVIPEVELCAEVSNMGQLWKSARKSQKIHSEQLDLGSAPPTEDDRALHSNDV
jgi:hypothetical protein